MVFFLFFLGISVGSFLNVLIDRLPREESVVKGRSHCDSCKRPLLWHDLIPLFSFIFLKGKCRYCHSPISFYYPIVELITGIMFAVLGTVILSTFDQLSAGSAKDPMGFFGQLSWPQNDKNNLSLIYYLYIASSLIVIFFADLKYGIIPDKIVYPGIVISLLYLFIIHNSLFIIHLLPAFSAFVFFLLLFLVTRGRGMGFGDVKLSFLMGLILGWPQIIVALYFAFLTGAVVGCIMILWGKKRISSGTIPFGPFLVLGAFISFFFGDFILQKIILLGIY